MSIISVSGYIGSGKDEIGKIIQYLTSNNIVFAGQHTGKISYDFFKSIYKDLPQEFEIKKWAYKVKQVATLITGIPIEKFEDQEFKESLLGSEWATIKFNPLNAIPVFEDVKFNHLLSIRELLQKIGTDAMRKGLHENVWINAMMSDYKENCDWIITDTRFPNELEAIKAKEGITIRVKRPHGYTDPHTGIYKEIPLSFHESETALDDAKFDYEILNDNSIEDLIEKVKLILKTEKII